MLDVGGFPQSGAPILQSAADGSVTLDGGTAKQAASFVNLSQTWGDAAVTFTGFNLNITNAASATGSKLIDLQVSGTSVFYIQRGVTGNNGVTAVKLGGVWVGGDGTEVYVGSGTPANTSSLFMFGSGQNPQLIAGGLIRWSSRTNEPYTSFDSGFARNAAGVVEINSGTLGTYRDLKLRNLIGTGNLATGVVAKTGNYTATTNDGTIEVDASGGAVTITGFACASNAGKIIVVKKTDSSGNAVTFDPNASETVDGAATRAVTTQYAGFIVQVNAGATAWNVIGTF